MGYKGRDRLGNIKSRLIGYEKWSIGLGKEDSDSK